MLRTNDNREQSQRRPKSATGDRLTANIAALDETLAGVARAEHDAAGNNLQLRTQARTLGDRTLLQARQLRSKINNAPPQERAALIAAYQSAVRTGALADQSLGICDAVGEGINPVAASSEPSGAGDGGDDGSESSGR